MAYLEVTIGASGSGKSTYAASEVKKWRGNLVEVNRDSIRRHLFGITKWADYKFTRENEQLVTDAQHTMIKAALAQGRNVICSDTNLNPKYRAGLREMAEAAGVEYRELWFNVPTDELQRRNAQRGNWAVAEHILESQCVNFFCDFVPAVNRWYQPDFEAEEVKQYLPDTSLPKAVIFDVDGTLADMADKRGAHDLTKVSGDLPRYNVINHAMDLASRGVKIVVVSGRQDLCREDTEKWLRKFGVKFDVLIMRKTDDLRNDAVVKQELFWADIAPKYNVLYSVDDRNRVVDMWRSIGVECWQVQEGDF